MSKKIGSVTNLISIVIKTEWKNYATLSSMAGFKFIFARVRKNDENTGRCSLFIPMEIFKNSTECDFLSVDAKLCGIKYVSDNSIGLVSLSTTYNVIDVFGIN